MPPTTNIPRNPREWEGTATADAALRVAFDAVGGWDGYNVNALYMAGDHGQDGARWRGVGYVGKTLAKSDWEVIAATQYVAIPEVEKCVARRTNAACAKEAEFSLSARRPGGPLNDKGEREHSTDQDTYAAAWKGDIGAWWSTERPVPLWDAVKRCTSHASAAGQGCIRLFWNQRFRQEESDDQLRAGIPEQTDRLAGLNTVSLIAPPPAACGIYYDPDTLSPVGIYRYRTAENVEGVELWFLDGERTICRQIEGDSTEEYPYDWGGILPIVPLSITPLLTEPVRQLQASVDTSVTSAMRLTISHGYAQRDEMNVRPSGELKDTPPPGEVNPYTEEVGGVTYYLWKTPRELGNGVTNQLYGITLDVEHRDDGGKLLTRREYQQPQVQYHEPSNPDNVFKSVDRFKREIREACHQGHIIDSGSSAEASGDAYEQHRAEFASDVDGVAAAVARLVSGILMAATVMADEVSRGGNPARFVADWSVVSQVHADPGPASSEKQRGAAELMDKGALSKRYVQKIVGVQDTEAEDEQIATESHPAVLQAHFAVVKAARDAGVTNIAAVYKALGYDDERAAELARNDFVEEDDDDRPE